jgi:hypothetical protein
MAGQRGDPLTPQACTPWQQSSSRALTDTPRAGPALTRVDLLVAAHAVGLHNALEAGREAIGADEGWRKFPAGDAVSHSAHSRLTLGCPGGEREAEAGGGGLQQPWTPQSHALRGLTGRAQGPEGSLGSTKSGVLRENRFHWDWLDIA